MDAVKEAVPAAALPQQAIAEERSPAADEAQQQQPVKPVRLVRHKDGPWTLARDGQLVNNLSWVVGFMEFANAGDFAANVWNEVPVPVYAVVFMAIGGTVAGVLSVFALGDARRACRNVAYLRRQRRLLHEDKRQLEAVSASTLDTDVILAINLRELGTELVTRWIMDLLMGFGAVLISVGTYMAIGGADRLVFLASNLLSGYVGNTPIALFGLFNSSWAAFIFAKAQRHVGASQVLLGSCAAAALVERRARRVQVFSVINGTATVLGGVGSMITATRWWGYVVLIPVILSSVFCNIWWRRMIGYSRRSQDHPAMVQEELMYALEFAAAAAEAKSLDDDPEALPAWCSDLPAELPDMMRFLVRHSLFHQYCVEVLANQDVGPALGGNTPGLAELSVTPAGLMALPSALHATLLEIARRMARDVGADHFRNRERYLAEILGTYCTLTLALRDAMTGQGAGRGEKDTK
ncbi:hypothetical protein NOR_08351 [Metarhizium rileyi]|uniref:Integral membrane protein n=1 Tax=Metarhizium rileyi (strain RCEF 4871) TaxID=1649241 RepID=A0A166WH76_METRR|nr:hypothetical protein NOR_08351 [Metarhizium rileyi RCEF 4871]